ncbi:endonuclease/exonuclease/phosphatase family protein [Kingella negevensis]|uniref:endonuclease/exonuclease/phosphatase family protein n=1 Tax=Kingella negevensis TaxID=1522312 RepID=UPI00050A018D|nr:endonuclease/exonuclease/phosphatase family protein [Kingella negevensis]MDK4688884.1 endonuclease/exonuclease/phosphatase family protein [Kingella negevensis]WII92061.1 endonuclease/exonuclease/phosphatase family protein [Kingella negevensis]
MRILSYNIQAAIASDSYFSYVSRLHRQVMPSPAKAQVLANIAKYISDFDVVCLQEIDLGGFRNGFQNQVQQLLAQTPFSHHICQTNRVVGKLSVHGNLILSKLPLREVVNEPLPSKIKGRGMLAAQVQTPNGDFVVANVHLSLGAVDQFHQMRFIRQKLADFDNVCVMGDFNCPPEAEQLCLLTDYDYTRLSDGLPTYPSWKPQRTLDHIFVKGRLKGRCQVSQFTASDHLPVILEIDDAA